MFLWLPFDAELCLGRVEVALAHLQKDL